MTVCFVALAEISLIPKTNWRYEWGRRYEAYQQGSGIRLCVNVELSQDFNLPIVLWCKFVSFVHLICNRPTQAGESSD